MATPAAVLNILVTANTAAATASLGKTEAQLKRTTATSNSAATAMGPKLASAAKMGAAAVGVGLVYGLGKAVAAGANFEKQMDATAAVSEANRKEMAKLEKQALALGQKTAYSALEVADAQEQLVKGGLRLSDVLGGALPAALSLAAAGEMDLGDAASTTVNAMKLFGLEGRDAAKVSDMLATAANRTTADVGDFAMALQQGGAVAKLAGINLNQTVTALEALAESGVKNSDAGTSLKAAFIQLLKPTEKQADLASSLNLEWVDSQGNLKSMAAISKELITATDGMTNSQRAATFATLAGTDGVRTLNALYSAGPEKLEALTRANREQGTAQDVAKQKMDNLSGSFEQLGGAAETLAIKVSKIVNPAVRDAVDWLTGALTDIANADLDKMMEDDSFRDFAEAMEEIGKATKVMWEKILWPTLKSMWPALKQVFGGGIKVISGFVQVIAGVLTLDFKQALNGMADIASGAFKALVGVVKYATAPIRAAFARVGEVAAQVFKAPVMAVVGAVRFVFDKAMGVISSTLRVAASIADKLSGVPIIGDKFRGLGDAANAAADDIDGFRDSLRGDDAAIKKEAKALEDLAKVFKDLGGTVADFADDVTDGVDKAVKAFDRTSDKTRSMAGKVGKTIRSLADTVSDGFGVIGRNTNSALQGLGVSKKVSFSLEKVGNSVGNVLGAQKGALVPGTGSGDKVPLHLGGQLAAMVEPGELVSVANRNATAALMEHNKRVPRFAAGGTLQPGIARLAEWATNRYGMTVSSGLRPGDSDSFHGSGEAVDLVPPSMGATRGIFGAFKNQLAELFYDPWGGYDNGQMIGAIGGHMDHIHAAIAGAGSGGVGTAKLKRLLLKGPDGPLKSLGQGALDKAHSAAQRFIRSRMGSAHGNVGAGALTEGQFLGLANRALAVTDASRIWGGSDGFSARGLLSLATAESSLIPSSINNWDINAKAGNPSGGLMHLTQSNMKYYAEPSLSSNMFDPLSSIAASINYQIDRYGGQVTHSPYQLGGIVAKLASGGVVGAQKGRSIDFRDPSFIAKRTAKRLRELTGEQGSIAKLDERLSIAQTLADADGSLSESEINRQVGLQRSLLRDLRRANKLSDSGYRYARLAGNGNLRSLFGSTRTEMSGVTGKGGRIFDTLQAIAGLNGTTPAGMSGMDISGLRSVIEAAQYGAFANLPKFHGGGVVPGPPSREVPIMARGGEHVSSGPQVLYADIYIGGEKVDERVEVKLRQHERMGRIGSRQYA